MRAVTIVLATVAGALVWFPSVARAQVPGDGTFQAAASHPAGSYPWSLALGDFDKDGTGDLVIANLGTGVSVLRGRPDGQFLAPQSSRAGYYPWALAVGDFNGDHADDIVVGNYYGGELNICLGNGDGTFRTPMAHLVDAAGVPVFAVADFDGDGRDDLAIARSGVRVLISNGGGTFRDGGDFGPGTYPVAIAARDLNGDSIADLAVASDAGTAVLLGNGDGSFQPPSRLGTGGAATAIGDFNGDNVADVATTGLAPTGLSVFLGHGDGTFFPEVRHGLDFSSLAATAGDFNGDGRDDLALLAFEVSPKTGILQRGRAAVLLAQGDGRFAPAVHYGTGEFPRALVASDLDDDGRIDLAVANARSENVSVLLNGPVTHTTTMHLGRLAANVRLDPGRASWRIIMVVRAEDANHAALPGTLISGTWNDGSSGACKTDLQGICLITRPDIPAGVASVTFTVTELTNSTHPEHAYEPSHNHSPTGDGTSITISKP